MLLKAPHPALSFQHAMASRENARLDIGMRTDSTSFGVRAVS